MPELLNRHNLRPLADIPNEPGYLFYMFTKAGRCFVARVARDGDGCHYVEHPATLQRINLAECEGWEP